MNLLDYLSQETITVDLKSETKKEAIKELCGLLSSAGKLDNVDKMVEVLMEREKLGSTGIGQGVAIPHAKAAWAKKQLAAIGISKKGVKFDALDGEPVHIFFMLVGPVDSAGLHLKTLARISRLLKDKFFRLALRESKTAEEVVKAIQEEDKY